MEHPAISLTLLCGVGGSIAYFRRGSLPSLIGGLTLSVLYGSSAYLLKKNADWGLELALGSSLILGGAGLSRSIKTSFKKPVPLMLLVLGTTSTAYYAKKYNDFYPLITFDD